MTLQLTPQQQQAIIGGTIASGAGLLANQIMNNPEGASRIVIRGADNLRERLREIQDSYRRTPSRVFTQGRRPRNPITVTSTPRTPGGTKYVRPKVKGSYTGHSGGFVKKGRRNWKKMKAIRFQRKGFSMNIEAYRTVADGELVQIGHHSAPQRTLLIMLWTLWFKHYFSRCHMFNGESVDDKIPTLNENNVITIKHNTSGQMNATTADETYAVPAGGCTINNLVTWAMATDRPWNFIPQTQFFAMTVTGTDKVLPAYLSMATFTARIFVKSSLKIQNSSRAQAIGADTEADDVNRTPLYGKTYEGNGDAPIYRPLNTASQVQALLGCDVANGVGYNVSALNGIAEPPQGSDFINVKRVGKIKLEPGEIKTSVLTHTIKSRFNVLWKKLNVTSPAAGDRKQHRYIGKYRWFFLEKMLKVNAQEISTHFECNLDLYGSGYTRGSKSLGRIHTVNDLNGVLP